MTTLVFRRGIDVLTGADSVIDRVRRRLLFFRGEWIFNPLLGVAYNEVFDSNGTILEDIKTKVLQVEGVTGADIAVRGFDGSSRTITIELQLETEFGRQSMEVQV